MGQAASVVRPVGEAATKSVGRHRGRGADEEAGERRWWGGNASGAEAGRVSHPEIFKFHDVIKRND